MAIKSYRGDPVLDNIDTRNNRLGVPLCWPHQRKAVNITSIEEGERSTWHLKIVSSRSGQSLVP